MNLLCSQHSFSSQGKETFLITSGLDNREKTVSSRTGLSAKPDLVLSQEGDLPQIDAKYIFVDEAQFLSEKNVEDLKNLARDKIVFLYGLKTDFKSKLFTGSKRILELADEIRSIFSTCDFCEKKAHFHIRLNENGEKVTSGPQVLPSYLYKSVCWEHYLR